MDPMLTCLKSDLYKKHKKTNKKQNKTKKQQQQQTNKQNTALYTAAVILKHTSLSNYIFKGY